MFLGGFSEMRWVTFYALHSLSLLYSFRSGVMECPCRVDYIMFQKGSVYGPWCWPIMLFGRKHYCKHRFLWLRGFLQTFMAAVLFLPLFLSALQKPHRWPHRIHTKID